MAILHGGRMRLKSFESLSNKITNWVFFIGLPLLLGVFLMMFYFSWRTDQRIEDIAEENKTISTQVKKLSKSNKNLSLENRELAKDNRAYNLCTAKLFAKYTRDNQPISIKNLKKCTVENVGKGQSDSTNSTSRGNSDSGTNSKSSTKSKQPDKPSDPDEPEPPTLLDEIIETINNASSNVLDDVLGD